MIAGPAIIIDQDITMCQSRPDMRRLMIYAKPSSMNAIPPTISYLHDIIRIIIRINDGIRWIKKFPSCCQIESPGENASKANKLTKRIAKMQIILGSQ